MELLRVESRDDIPPFDREILNERLHQATVGDVWGADDEFQEYLALGMSKGSILLLHVRKLHQLYCRFTVHREAVEMVRYLPRSKTFVSVGREQDFWLWTINKEERNVKLLSSFKIVRNLRFFCVMDGWSNEAQRPPQQGSKVDRFWLGFESGDQEVFQYDGEEQALHLIESEKQKEHEAPLTGLDYHRKLELMVTSCEGGSIRVWSKDKKFLREIAFPQRIDSVCFLNAKGDLLVSHDKRVSLINIERYRTKTFEYVASHAEPVRLTEASDELFEELRQRDDQARGKKARTKALPSRGVLPSRSGRGKGRDKGLSLAVAAAATLTKATVPLLQAAEPKPAKPAKEREPKPQRQPVKRAPAVVDDYHPREPVTERRLRADSVEESDRLDLEMYKPHRVTALPRVGRKPVTRRPLPGVSYLSTSGLYEDLVAHRKAFQLGHMTRRNITEHKISSNILNHNSPIVVQNFDSLNLGPQLPRHRRFVSTFEQHRAALERTADAARQGKADAAKAGSGVGIYASSKSGAKRRSAAQEYSLTKVVPAISAGLGPTPLGASLNGLMMAGGLGPGALEDSPPLGLGHPQRALALAHLQRAGHSY